MRKSLVLTLVIGLFGAAVPTMANDEVYDWWAGVEIDPADAFDKSKMVRTFTVNGKEYEDLSVVTMQGDTF